jgi:hypothetical protein
MAIPQLLQVGDEGGVEFGGFGLLLFEPREQPTRLGFERFVSLLLFRGAHVAAGGEHVTVLADFLQRRAPAEAGDIPVNCGTLTPTPSHGERGKSLSASVSLSESGKALTQTLAQREREGWPRRGVGEPEVPLVFPL